MTDDAIAPAPEPRAIGPMPVARFTPVPPQQLSVEPVLVTVGDIACSSTTVFIPSGQRHPLAGTTWIVTHQTTVTQRIPAYAIVLAVLLALACLLGLLFLLVKEESIQGFVQVSVQSPGFYYATQVPIGDKRQVIDVEQRVEYIRGMVAALG
ncbi:hypothetical protein [Nocardia sp. NPDC052566]|uniref:hypothetical protein n=1 Tax=Nocardia sp. NPDC052566 TaxID=3364330 RepID=UPI0037C699CA